MNCTTFRTYILAILDGELPAEQAAAAHAHSGVCGDCAGRLDAERAFEARFGAALLGAADPAATAALVAVARSRVGAAPSSSTAPAGRVVRPPRLIRRLVAVAALLFVAVEGAWFLCIPPFECSLLQAVEAASESDSGTPLDAAKPADGALARVHPPDAIGEFRRAEPPRVTSTGMAGMAQAICVSYHSADGDIVAVWGDPGGHEPSFRRATARGGREWWIAEERGRTIVSWKCRLTGALCSLVGELPEERLLAVAEKVRAATE